MRRELLAEGRKHLNMRLLQQTPMIGSIRAVLLLALIQTPNCFRTKRQLWAYCGLALTDGPFQDFYQACLARGMKPHLARLTLARKIAAITLLVWKKGVRFDAEHLKQQAA